MSPEERNTRDEFAIKTMERIELERVLMRYCVNPHPEIMQAIEAYACASARAAIAVCRAAEAQRGQK